MRKTLILCALSTIPAIGFAKPSYSESRAIYDVIVKPIEQTGIWHQKPMQERIAAVRDAEALIKQAERVFGDTPFGDGAPCRDAAIRRRYYISGLNDMVRIAEGTSYISSPHDLLAPMRNAVAYGEAKVRCYTYVESLDAKALKK